MPVVLYLVGSCVLFHATESSHLSPWLFSLLRRHFSGCLQLTSCVILLQILLDREQEGGELGAGTIYTLIMAKKEYRYSFYYTCRLGLLDAVWEI